LEQPPQTCEMESFWWIERGKNHELGMAACGPSQWTYQE
jgi:hypothetical protein